MRIRSVIALLFALLVIIVGQATVVGATGGVIDVTQDGCDFTFTITPSEPYGYLNLTIWDLVDPVEFTQDFQTTNTEPIVFNYTIPPGEDWEYVFWDRGVANDEYNLIERALISCTEDEDDPIVVVDDDEESDEDEGPTAGPPFIPGDPRLNLQAGAPAAIFCDGANSQLTIYAIGQDGHGTLAFALPYAAFDSTAPFVAGLIRAQGNISVLQSAQGDWLVRAAQRDGKLYEFIFSGCPYIGDGVAAVY